METACRKYEIKLQQLLVAYQDGIERINVLELGKYQDEVGFLSENSPLTSHTSTRRHLPCAHLHLISCEVLIYTQK